MREIIQAIFGQYTPLTETVSETIYDGGVPVTMQVQHAIGGFSGIDFEYIAGVLLFAIVLYGFIRMVGGILK